MTASAFQTLDLDRLPPEVREAFMVMQAEVVESVRSSVYE